jgi:hypothetical protein
VQEKSRTVADLWDGSVLKCTFRRGFDQDWWTYGWKLFS